MLDDDATLEPRRPPIGGPGFAVSSANDELFCYRDREALDLFHQVVALRGKTLTDDHPIVAATLNGIGRALATMGRYGDAEKTIHEAIAIRRANLPPGHWAIISSELALAEVQLKAKRYREAEPAILSAYQRLLAAVGPGHTRVRDARAEQDASESLGLHDRLIAGCDCSGATAGGSSFRPSSE